jgi:hypothetical protein
VTTLLMCWLAGWVEVHHVLVVTYWNEQMPPTVVDHAFMVWVDPQVVVDAVGDRR